MLCIADVAPANLGLDEVPGHHVHVAHADLHEGLCPLPGKAHHPAPH